MRLFVSVDLPELADAIAAVQRELAPAAGLRLTDPANAHVTVKFLGEVEPDRLDAVSEALETAVWESDVGPFELSLGGLGAFPSTEYIQVVWVGVDAGSGSLTTLHEAVEAEYTAMGFDPTDHEFTPHVTIGRMDHGGGKERVQQVLRERDPAIGRHAVEEVALTESTLTDTGPEYDRITTVPLVD
ncbi:MAG: RNA 2',3'-cyclic phosphodiesterase [Halobacteriaceae archaeon]